MKASNLPVLGGSEFFLFGQFFFFPNIAITADRDIMKKNRSRQLFAAVRAVFRLLRSVLTKRTIYHNENTKHRQQLFHGRTAVAA